LEKCALIPEDAARLACFDAYTAQVKAQNTESLKETKTYTEKAAQAEEEQRQKDFGLTSVEKARREAQKEMQEAQSADPESKPAKPKKPMPESLVAYVKTFTRNNRTKRIRITLDNGQVWQEIDANPFHGKVKVGTMVTIIKRPFGGYKIKVPERSAPIFVRRLK